MLNYLKKETNFTTTENGGITHKTSESKVLDYFSQGSSLRNRSYDEIINLVERSLSEDKLLTLKVLFNSRDIRNGQGERSTFRKIIKYLANEHTDLMINNVEFIPQFGRWDDIFALYDTPLQDKAVSLIKEQLIKDLNSNDEVSLCAKWMPSENASSKETKKLALKTSKLLDMTPKRYRQTLSILRKKIDLLETKITNKEYSKIEYDKIPSQAGLKYSSAFFKNDFERYTSFLSQLSSGEKKVNVGTLLPYQLVGKALKNPIEIYNEMWKQLPDFINEDTSDTIAVIDTSGSMYGTPLEMAISLGLYLAEKNKGAFKNHFITFATNPELVEIIGDTFIQKVLNISYSNWGGSTNIEATFDLILDTAKKYNLPQSELPERIVIISDMEFDEIEKESYLKYSYINNTFITKKNNLTNFDVIKEKFRVAGYKLPRLVFWNVDARQDNIPMTMTENVQLVSGPSPKLFEMIVKDLSAYDLMIEILNNKIYDCISV